MDIRSQIINKMNEFGNDRQLLDDTCKILGEDATTTLYSLLDDTFFLSDEDSPLECLRAYIEQRYHSGLDYLEDPILQRAYDTAKGNIVTTISNILCEIPIPAYIIFNCKGSEGTVKDFLTVAKGE